MFPIKHILFPMDFSESCGSTAPFVASMARRCGAKITLLNVVQPYWYVPMAEAPPVFIDLEEIRSGLERDLTQSFCDEFAGLRVDHQVTIGEPAQVITEFAEKNDVDLVMMPTHGYGLFRELLLGSVTAKVLHDCTKPVWTSAHVKGPRPLVHIEVRNILCATDVAAKSEKLLHDAADFAVAMNAKLRLAHVVPTPSAWPDRQIDALFEESLIQQARTSLDRITTTLPIETQLCVFKGDVASCIKEAAERFTSDLVIIGRGVLQRHFGRLRTNAYGIIRESPCPVLSI